MAQNLTASALVEVQARLEELFAPGQSTPSRYPWVEHLGTARGMLENHRAAVGPVVDNLGRCVGYKVYHLEKGSATLDYDGDGSAHGLVCDIVSAEGVASVESTLAFNMLKVKNIEVSDDICGNLFADPGRNGTEQAATIIAQRLNHAMNSLRKGLNASFITFLNANKSSVNNDASLPTGITFGTSLFTVTETTLSMNDPDTLTDLEAIAINNDMTDYFFVAGRNHFYNARRNAEYHALNDNERDVIRWGDTPIYFDIKNLDSTLSGKNSFIVDPGAFIFFNHVDEGLSFIPEMVSEADNLFEYIVEDPILRFNNGGMIEPIRYQLAYQKICNNVNASTLRRTFTHRWEVKLHGGLYAAPPAEDTHTGILKFKSA